MGLSKAQYRPFGYRRVIARPANHGKNQAVAVGRDMGILIRTIGQSVAIRCSIIGCGTTSIYVTNELFNI